MGKYQITVDGRTFEVEVGDVSASPVQVVVDGVAKSVAFAEQAPSAAPAAAAPVAAPAPKPAPAAAAPKPVAPVTGKAIKAPMPGKILQITVKMGQAVKEGDTVCTLEAMKMEMPISATVAGTVAGIHVAVGTNVAFDDPLVSLS